MRHSRGRGESGLGHLAPTRFTRLDRRGLDRRIFIGGSLCLLAAPAAWARSVDRDAALAKSKLVYISPLKSNGNESACHAEVWFGWIDGSVVINTSPERWKARAVKQGLERARIWVGDFGPWKRMLGKNERFRKGPRFDAKAEIVKDDALIDDLLKEYDEKYPEEIVSWRDKMRSGYFDGSRVLIRYTPFD